MRLKHVSPFSTITILTGLLLILGSPVVHADRILDYKVTIHNLATGQPLSPPVAATHKGPLRMFKVGAKASDELEAIAEDGNQIPMFNLFFTARKVTDVVDIGAPLPPETATTFDIMARPGDRLSLATMLICTNDGFTGLNRVRLPKRGARILWTAGYDAGTEDNTELSMDIVDPCSLIGPVPLPGDPNGNEDAAVDTSPPERIQHHPNIQGTGDLTVADHGWTDPVAKITVTHVADDAVKFLARLSGPGEVPPVLATNASGYAKFALNENETELKFRLKALKVESGIVQAHIHQGLPSANGPVVAFLFGPVNPPKNRKLNVRGRLTEADLIGPLVGDFAGFVDALRAGELYVNVHSATFPSGEIRGQIGAR